MQPALRLSWTKDELYALLKDNRIPIYTVGCVNGKNNEELENMYGIIHAGDSRCYLYQGRKWKQVTVDEVWENQPDISDRERMRKDHPNRGKLVNAIGIRENVRCRVMTDIIASGAVFLLSSDGLYKYCRERFIKGCVKRCTDLQALERSVGRLIEKVYQNGAGDNISVVIIKCCEE